MTAYSPIISPIAGIKHGFGDKSALLPTVLQPWEATLPLKKQVHGTHIQRVSQSAEQCGEADGLITSTPGLLLTVLTADCLPVLFCRRNGAAIGVVHAGWRGLLAGILERFADVIARDGDSTANWVAAVGPAAGPCCYEVSPELAEEFSRRLDAPPELIQPRHRHLDLAAIAAYKLASLGFDAVDVIGHCTICQPAEPPREGFRYTSFRRNAQRRALDTAYPTITGRNQHSGLVIAA